MIEPTPAWRGGERLMGYAYTPGLTVAEHTVVRKVRRLPLKGQVLVKVGQKVDADDVVAQTELPGDVKPVNVVGKLGISPEELPEIMLKKEGDAVAAKEPFARTKGFFGFFRNEAQSPIDGTIESISHVTGQVIIRGRPTLLQKKAYANGVVVDVAPGESATVEIQGTFVQGIFGIGGETSGEIVMAVSRPDEILDAAQVLPAHAGKIIIGGNLVTAAAVKQAVKVGVRGIVCGGLNDADLRNFLGYELGVAITGEETLGVTVVITEGFGRISMAKATFELLKRRVGLKASINGATQIRAGVIRPEVIIPLADRPVTARVDDEMSSVLQVGTAVRAIREPFFGRIGKCVALPVELERLSSETKVRVLVVQFDNGDKATVPRANVELIKR
jgi:hypothetical protein